MKRLWDYLNADVTSLLSRGEPGGATSERAQQLIASARAEAKRRGVRVEDVLRERGHLPNSPLSSMRHTPAPVESGPQRPTSAMRPTSPGRRAPARPPSRRAEAAFDEPPAREWTETPPPAALPPQNTATDWTPLNELLHPLIDDEVEAMLNAATGDRRLLARLRFLDVLKEDEFRRVSQYKRPEEIISAIGQFGVPAKIIADMIKIEPFCPPVLDNGESFFDFLLEHDHLRYRDFRNAQRAADAAGRPLLESIRGVVMEEEAYIRHAAQFAGLEIADKLPEPEELDEEFPADWVRLFDLVPISATTKKVVVASSYVLPRRLRAKLESHLERRVENRLCGQDRLQPLIEGYRSDWTEARGYDGPSDGTDERSELLAQLITAESGVQLVDQLLGEAFSHRATDVHIEPAQHHTRVRYRIDGICHEVVRLPLRLSSEVIGRIKVLAGMDVTERRRSQDGHINYVFDERERDLRIATIPARFGEKVSIRVANTGQVNTRLEVLGLATEALTRLRDQIMRPYGMVLATGPVGSGKTTTLYSCLNEFDRNKYHAMTIEDPVEIDLPGVNQVQVNIGVGMTMTRGLRALLRQDPDKVLIGEIRDEETARIAVRASMTGLMVFSTLHANDSTGAITTLRNFGIPSFLIAGSLRAVIAQRLLRRICPHCKVKQPLSELKPEMAGLEKWPKDFQAWKGKGCDACFGTGYQGRIGVFELFAVDPTVREMIFEEASVKKIREHVLKTGMPDLGSDARLKINDGITTVEEFDRLLRF